MNRNTQKDAKGMIYFSFLMSPRVFVTYFELPELAAYASEDVQGGAPQ